MFKNGKVAGRDKISTETFKNMELKRTYLLQEISSKAWSDEKIPKDISMISSVFEKEDKRD